MQKIKVVIVGMGNVGRYVLQAVRESEDVQVVGIVELPERVTQIASQFNDLPVTSDIDQLEKPDVAILAIDKPSGAERCVEIPF
ncbi:Gfo/Idh/MocA family oxidoreductase [Thermotoga sp. Ku-13t]|uniref:Gfo/Idh/MocA family oxidoreductase n=1 Tax=Thermotoga sp. Ku-13t TaxID=1755813 RepID=UPI0019D24B1F|nr:Gfo/Idh/MocA family oxidoreductase [Thermotoga sp. Ku-13t]